MLRSLKDFERYTLAASDGDIGTVVNFLLDDRQWTVRYMVAETGSFFDERKVLISPISFRKVDGETRHFHLSVASKKIKESPSIDVEKPISRQHERDYFRHYGYPYYWGHSGIWGTGSSPALLSAGEWIDAPVENPETPHDAHLRSASELRGYHIQGSDDTIGHVEDFIVDDETWKLRYMVIDTSNWWFGKKVLIAPHWARHVSWEEQTVHVDLPRLTIKNAPEWNPAAPINREYETHLYDYYGRPADWENVKKSP